MSDTSRTSDADNNAFYGGSGTPAATGHPIGFWFFFWGEFAERCSYYGMRAILALYMIQKLGVEKSDAGTYVSLFIAACYFLPILGGLIADNYLGKYWTIVGFSLPYIVGQVLVGVEDKTFVMIALGLLAMGSGVIKPNISTLMGLTYDQQRPGQEQLRTSAFSWFYLAINTGAFLSQNAMPILRDKYGYQVAFMFPAALMTVALIIFASGKRFYATETVGKAARDEEDPNSPSKISVLGKIGALFALVMFFWAIFDQSASTWIFFADTYMNCHMLGREVTADQIQAYNALFILVFLPMSVWLFKSLANAGYKIRATDKMMAGFLFTFASMAIMSYAGYTAGKSRKMVRMTSPNGEHIIPASSVEFTKIDAEQKVVFGTDANSPTIEAKDWKFNEKNKKITFSSGVLSVSGKSFVFENGLMKEGADVAAPNGLDKKLVPEFKLSDSSAESVKEAVANAKDGVVVTLETVDYVEVSERVTVWWQVFAYMILTIAEILISVTGLELAFVVAPKSMKGFVTACWLGTTGCANLFINAPITRLYPLMQPGPYFAMLAGALAVVTLILVFVAKKFNR